MVRRAHSVGRRAAGALLAVVASQVLVPAAATSRRQPPVLTARDLVTIKDIGPTLPVTEMKLFGLSPDGRWLAFQLREADPDTNSHRLSMELVALPKANTTITVDRGGDLIRLAQDAFGKAAFETGIPFPITPRWSPDSRWFAFLKRTDGVTRVWRAFIDGRPAEPMTDGRADVEDFALTPGGRALVVQTRPALAAARAARSREGLTGYHVDERFMPLASSLPYLPSDLPRVVETIDLATRVGRAATAAEAALITPVWQAVPSPALVTTGTGPVSVMRRVLPGPGLEQRIVAISMAGAERACASLSCRGQLTGPWPSRDRRAVMFLRREGWADSETALYRWRPGDAEPRRLLVTTDAWNQCETWRGELLCLAEGSTTPRHFIRVDPETGQWRTVHDPNPDFRRFALGKVLRERWTDPHGVRNYGHVILPTGYRVGRRYPLIVVQYQSRGFLRGGTGDEYPIQLFASHGYVVLSHNNPRLPAQDGVLDFIERERVGLRDFAKREGVLSSIETAVRAFVARGIADPARIGITGLSDGSSTVQFAAVNSRTFSAGISSSCCREPEQDALLGPRVAELYGRIGWPRITDRAEPFWKRMSLVRSGSNFPLLFQHPDDEYLLGLTGLSALRARGTPTAMFVYPGEFHNKYQASHRLAIYQRNLAWFDYWFKDIRPVEPAWSPYLPAWDIYKRERRRTGVDATLQAVAPTSTPPNSPPRGGEAGERGGDVRAGRTVATPAPRPPAK